MGVHLVTAFWEPSNMDDSYISKLSAIALRHGASVNVHPNLSSYRAGKTRFSAEISGFSIPWHGGSEKCIAILKEIQKYGRDFNN